MKYEKKETLKTTLSTILKNLEDQQAICDRKSCVESCLNYIEELKVLKSYFILICFLGRIVMMKIGHNHLNTL